MSDNDSVPAGQCEWVVSVDPGLRRCLRATGARDGFDDDERPVRVRDRLCPVHLKMRELLDAHEREEE